MAPNGFRNVNSRCIANRASGSRVGHQLCVRFSRHYCPKRTVVPEIAEAIMPLRYKVPGYLGNALLLSLGLIIVGRGDIALGVMLAALSALNLFLVYKLDWSSREEGLLAHELEITKMRE